ncbi:MAG: hypothetical protein IK123_10110, partial [Lachnospiraceae bacterium]|nr:hypothetical protein [Lachnospiraceae bacterium]
SDVTVTAHFISISPEPTSSGESKQSVKSEPEEPDPTTTLSYFYGTVTDQVNAVLALIKSGNIPAEYYNNGITIDAGVWDSFNAKTCEELDKLLAANIPITINYLHKGNNKTIYIPARFPFTFTQMCDNNGYVGFEYIFAVVARGELLPKNDTVTEPQNELMGRGVDILGQANTETVRAGEKAEIISNGNANGAGIHFASPSSAILTSASRHAGSIGGTLLQCVTTSSLGITLRNATVNFPVQGVYANDSIVAYQLQGNEWVQLSVISVLDNHVNVNLTQHGPVAFIRVAAVAMLTP